MPKKIFLISPVRQITDKIKEDVRNYVVSLEKEGHNVHWPIRDTDQNDPIGVRICDDNLQKIFEADEIQVYYVNSTGINFDLGAAYMLKLLGYPQKITFINENAKAIERRFIKRSKSLRKVLKNKKIKINYSKDDLPTHFIFGAAYLLIRILGYKKQVIFANKNSFPESEISLSTEFIEKGGKSFLRVLNFIDNNTKKEAKNA